MTTRGLCGEVKLFSAIVTLVLLAAGAASAAGAAEAAAATPSKLVSYHGYRFRVPAAWPVFRLDREPSTCVRFNRHAVYLGSPSSQQRCPAHSIGRTEAILIQPHGATAARRMIRISCVRRFAFVSR